MWSGNICYGLTTNCTGPKTLFKVNLKAKEAVEIGKREEIAGVYGMLVDDGDLIICTMNNDKNHVTKRIPLK